MQSHRRIESTEKGTFGHLFKLACSTRDGWHKENSKPRANAKLVLDAGNLWHVHIDSVDADDLAIIFDTFRKAGNSGSTINRKKSALSVLFTLARESRYTDKAFSFLKQTGSAEMGRARVFTNEELHACCEGCKELGYDLLEDTCKALLYTGMRVGELYHVYDNKRLYNVDTRMLRIKTLKQKNKRGNEYRTIKLSSHGHEAILNLFAQPMLYNRRLLNSRWDTLRAFIGHGDDSEFVLHVFRHTCASRQVAANVQLAKVKAFMGHANIQTTMRYVHVDNDLDDCADALEGAF